jgi:hypothetical protein
MRDARVLGIIRQKSEFGDSFVNVLFSQPTNHQKKKSDAPDFFRIFLSAARLASDRLTAALHKPAGTSCREKVVNKNVNASDAKRNTAPSDIIRRRLRPDRR